MRELKHLLKRPVGDVLAAVRAVLVVDVEGEALVAVRRSTEVQIGNVSCAERARNVRSPSYVADDQDSVLVALFVFPLVPALASRVRDSAKA